MKVYDISQELFGCVVFPGDPAPKREVLMRIEDGDVCNLTALSMCAHNGTHVDAPRHFYKDGKTIDEVALTKFIGPCFVYHHDGPMTEDDARKAFEQAKSAGDECYKKMLFSGSTVVTEEAAKVFAAEKIDLIGNESQTVGPEDGPMAVHLILLKEEIVLLEGIRLSEVQDGKYFLNACPVNLGGSDGAPCRAVLMSDF